MTASHDITASIVTYNSGPVIGACLEHLTRSTQRSLEIVIWDNASSDDTAQQLARWQAAAKVELSSKNLGFGQGHNASLAQATGRYFLILNPDIELPDGGTDRLCEYLDSNPSCGAVSPMLDEGENGLCGCSMKYPGHRYARRVTEGLPGDVAALQGACLLVRAEVFRAVGGFDRRFFLYAEDVDLSLAIRKHGFALHCLHTLQVRHIGGHSEKSFSPWHVAAKKQLGLLLFYKKYYPRSSRAVLIARDLLKAAWRLLGLAFASSPRAVARREDYRGRIQGTIAYLSGKTRL